MSASVTRGVLGSYYDHVALVLREYGQGSSDPNDVYLFESMRNKGVNTCSFQDFLDKNWDQLYEEVVYRKLHFRRTPKVFEKI